jgi:hypothetical protein
MNAHDEVEAPLDPAAERLRRKLVRLLIVSGGIMMLGLIAVFAAIVYKVGGAESPSADAPGAGTPIEASVPVPEGARVVAADLDGERALLTVEHADGTMSLLLVDLASGAVVGRYLIGGE